MFDTKASVVEGPYLDPWGSFVSGAVPILDPATGAVPAVLVMDMDAGAWKWDLARAGIPPVVFTLSRSPSEHSATGS